MHPSQHEAIREAAYYKWRSAGMPEGDGLKFWLEAEREHLRIGDEKGTDIVQEASEESFPASDAPGWQPLQVGVGHVLSTPEPRPKASSRKGKKATS